MLASALERPQGFLQNLRDLPRYLTVSAVTAAAVAALVAFTGPVLLIFEAARTAELTTSQLNSWILAVAVGGGVVSVALALAYRQPICGAWPIAGTVLMITTLPRYTLSEAVGAYLISGAILLALALSGLFGKAMDRIPPPIVMGMLAGVLLRFGLGIFTPLPTATILVLAMIVAFLGLQRLRFKAPTLGALLVGMGVAGIGGEFRLSQVEWGLTVPEIFAPAFVPDAVLSISLPLALLTMTSQNAPGIGILWSQGYKPPSNAITLASGVASLLTAPLGGNGINMAAPMTAICSSPEAHPDPNGRYVATVVNGLLLISLGLLGATASSVMRALPIAVVGVVAGLAMVPALIQAFRSAFTSEGHLYGAFFALAIAASDVTLLNVGAPFWSLVVGIAVSRLLDKKD